MMTNKMNTNSNACALATTKSSASALANTKSFASASAKTRSFDFAKCIKNKNTKKIVSLLSLPYNKNTKPSDYEDREAQKKRDIKVAMERKIKELAFNHEMQGYFSGALESMTTDALRPSLDSFSEILKRFELSLSDSMKELVGEFGKKITVFALAITSIYVLYQLTTSVGPALLEGLKIAIMATGKNGSEVVMAYLNKPKWEEQGDFGPASYWCDVGSMLLGFFLLDTFDVKNFAKTILNHKKRESTATAIGHIGNFFSMSYHGLKSFLTGEKNLYAYAMGDAEVSDWISRIEELKIDMVTKRMATNTALYEYVTSLVVVGYRLKYKYIASSRDMDSVKSAIRMGITDIESVLGEIDKSSFNKCSIRIKPLTIALKGKSGVGKSAMTVPLLDNILMRTFNTRHEMELFRQNNMDFIYSRAPETEFWDGYFGQKAVVIDDFMQADELRVNNALANEAFELIRMSNVYPQPLHQAHLEDKGKSYMQSRIILCSTNNFELQSQVIKEGEALTRRFDVSAIVYPKVEFCTEETKNGELSRRRLKKLEQFTTEVYEIHVEGINQVMNYESFADYCVQVYNELAIGGENYLKKIREMRDEVFQDALTGMEEQGLFGEDAIERKMRCTKKWLLDGLNEKTFKHDFPSVVKYYKSKGLSFKKLRKDELFADAYVWYLCNAPTLENPDHQSVLEIFKAFNKWAMNNFGQNPFPDADEIDVQFYERPPLKNVSSVTTSDYNNHLDFCNRVAAEDETDLAEYNALVKEAICRNQWVTQGNTDVKTLLKELKMPETTTFGSRSPVNMDEITSTIFSEREKEIQAARELKMEETKKQMEEFMVDELARNGEVEIIRDRYSYIKLKLNETLTKVKSFIKSVLEKYPILHYLEIAGGVLAIAGTLYAVPHVTNYIKGKAKQLPDLTHGYLEPTNGILHSGVKYGPLQPGQYEQMIQQSGTSVKHTTKVPLKNLGKLIVNMTQQGDEVDPRVGQNYMSISRQNMYSLERDGKHVCYVIFVKDRVCLVNWHIYHSISTMSDSKIGFLPLASLISGTRSGLVEMTRDEFCALEVKYQNNDYDVVAMDLGVQFRQHKDITNMFLTEKEIASLGKNPQAMVFVPNREQGRVEAYNCVTTLSNISYSKFKDITCYAYAVPTRRGDCGSLSLVMDKCSGYGKILSFHGLGNGTDVGVGVVIPDLALQEVMHVQGNLQETEYLGHQIVKKVDDPVFLSRKTKLRKSVVNGWIWPCKKRPSALKKVDGVDPFDLALVRYATPDPKIDERILFVSANNYANKLQSLPFSSKKILTFEEAVAGIAGNPYINGIPRKTSPGYPFVHKYKNGKKQIFGEDGDYLFNTEGAREIKEICEKKLQKLQQNERPEFIYMDVLKDELRSQEKVEKLSTRMVSCCPLDLAIITRMFFGAFAAFMMENKIMSGSAVGINPFSRDWADLARFLGNGRGYCVAGDFSSFDATQSSRISQSIVDIINDWYGDSYSQIRENLWREVINSRHLHGEYVVEFTHCLPSGHPMTSIANSMFVNLAFRMCWVLQNQAALSSIDAFDDCVALVAYGDDNICQVRGEGLNVGFDFQAIQEGMNQLGLTYTPEDKNSDSYTYKHLTDCTFLKRSFDLREGIWYAPLDLNTVLEMPMWYRNGPDVIGRQRENIENTLKELSIHGDHTFEVYSTILLNECYKVNDILKMSFIPKPIEYYMEKCFTGWLDGESLEEEEFSIVFLSNVPQPMPLANEPADRDLELGLSQVVEQ